MAVRKSGKKREGGRGKKTPAQKITLPAYGLAEDILGSKDKGCDGQESAVKSQGPVAERDAQKPVINETPSGQDAFYASGPDQARPDTIQELHLVTFNLDREEYGVDISSVHEIIRVGQITAVPNAPFFVQGVINLRGRVLPVINLRKKLFLPDEAFTKNSRIMVVESGGRVLGLLVDGVSQVRKIPVSSVDPPPGEVEQSRAFVLGIGKVDSRLIMIVDIEKVISKEASQTSA